MTRMIKNSDIAADRAGMKTHVLVLAVLGCALVFSGVASADAIPFSYGGPGVSVAGTLFGSNNADGSWTITGITATYNQIAVTQIVPPNSDPYFATSTSTTTADSRPMQWITSASCSACRGWAMSICAAIRRRAPAVLADMLPSFGMAGATSLPKSPSQTLVRQYPSQPH